MNFKIDAITNLLLVAKELVARDELTLALSLLDACYVEAGRVKYSDLQFECAILKMYCNKEDDAYLDNARFSIPHDHFPPEVLASKVHSYTTVWNLKLIYQAKATLANDPELKASYTKRAELHEKIVAQWSYSKVRNQSIEIAPHSTSQYDPRKFKEEAEKILFILQNKPLLPRYAYQISARSRNIMGDSDAAMVYCEKALSIDPKSSSALEVKIDLLLESIHTHLQSGNDSKLIPSLLDYIAIKPSADMYIKLGFAYFRSSEHHEALLVFRKARACDKSFKSDVVSLNIVHCLFQLAKTKKEFKRCAIKLGSYLHRHGTSEPLPVVSMMIDYFSSQNIHVDHTAVCGQDPGTPKKKLKPLEHETDDASWSVPEEIREKTKAALLKMGFMSDSTIARQDHDPVQEYKIDANDLYSLGDHTQFFIDPQLKIPEERKAAYIKALKKGRALKSSSHGGEGPKKLSDGRWEVKTKGIYSKYRLLSTATFFVLCDVPSASPEGDSTKELKATYCLGKEKSHSQV